MPLQFASLDDLKTDLQAKDGIYDVYDIANTLSDLTDINRHDLAIGKKTIDSDGTERVIIATQQVIEEIGSGTYGYGNNRQWDLNDASATTFRDRVRTKADEVVANNAGILKIRIDRVDEDAKTAEVTVYQDATPVTTVKHLVWDDAGTLNNRLIA